SEPYLLRKPHSYRVEISKIHWAREVMRSIEFKLVAVELGKGEKEVIEVLIGLQFPVLLLRKKDCHGLSVFGDNLRSFVNCPLEHFTEFLLRLLYLPIHVGAPI